MKRIIRIFGAVIGVLLTLFILLLILPERETVKKIIPRETTQYWKMKEGFQIAYSYLPGKSDKTPIIFLHGGPGGYVHSSIINTMKSVANKGHAIYLYDQRGSGLSDRMEKYSDIEFQKHLDDLDEIITEKIKSDQVILMGQSFGTIIATHYVALHPKKVQRMIFCSPGELLPYPEKDGKYLKLDSLYPTPKTFSFITPYNFVKDVDNMALKPKAMVASIGALLLDKKLISDQQMDRILNTLASQFTKGMVCDTANVLPEEGGGGLYAYIATNGSDFPKVRGKLKNLNIPVLVMQGQCDFNPFSVAYEYVSVFPNSQYQWIPNAGHEIWWEQEEVFVASISDFLATP